MSSITERYRWLIKRFEREFGKKNIFYSESNCGGNFAIGIRKGAERRWAFMVEGYFVGNLGVVKFYSLNHDKNQDKKVKTMIFLSKLHLEEREIMTVVALKGGFKIKSHKSGKVYPKLYPTRAAAKRRIRQMKRYSAE